MMRGFAVRFDKTSGKKSDSLIDRVLKRSQQVFIPIGVPAIAGPGAVTSVTINGHQSDSPLTAAIMSLTVIGVLYLLFLSLLAGGFITRLFGIMPLELISRVFGMILIAQALQFMVDRLVATFPGWIR